MLFKKFNIIFFLFISLFTAKATAQQSLGDPVFMENFGHGTNLKPIGPAMPYERTRLAYIFDKCPGVDQYGKGQYSLAFGTSNCFDGTWHTIAENHTPNDPYGYMMIINASIQPEVIYTNKVDGSKMCGGAKYQFQVWLYNILDAQPGVTDYQQPDIEFMITKTDGTPITILNNSTGPITQHGDWVPYSVDFLAPADGSDLIISLKDKTVGSDNGNDFVLDDITVKPYGPVINVGFNNTTNNGPQTQCLNDGPAAYVLKSHVQDYLNPQYHWQLSYNNSAWADIPGKTEKDLALNTEFQSPEPGKYQYRVGVLSSAGASLNCQTFSEPLTINVVKNPAFALSTITKVCEGKALRLVADKGSDYVWTLPDGTEVPTHFLDVTTSANSSHQGVYKVRITDNGCTTETQTQVVVYPQLIATVDNTDLTICEGEPVQLGANGGSTYQWDNAESLDNADIAKPYATPAQTTEYHVLISNGGCAEQRTVTVKVLKKPFADAGPDKVMEQEKPITLNGSAIGTNVNHYWTPTDYMDDPTSLTPKISPPDNITYTLHVESADCGMATDDVTVRVLKKITIPTTFTPNSDGVNDTWHIDKLNTYPESMVIIYTRDGHEIFKTLGDAKQWDGTYEGKPLPAGVYYYVIDLKNNLSKKAGWVMLIR